MNEEQIVEGLKNKNESCLNAMIAIYGKLAYSVAYKIVADIDPQVVEELTSDTFYDLWSKAQMIDLKRGSLKNLICLVARSKALNHRRMLKRGQCSPLYENNTEEGVDPESQMLEEEDLQELLEIIKEQNEPVSTIFTLRYLYYYSIAEIAEKLGMKRSQVDNYLSRGRKRLLDKLGQVR